MAQFIELGRKNGKRFVNIDRICFVEPFTDEKGNEKSAISYDFQTAGYVHGELPDEVMAKIKEAQANDPLERIAIALETISKSIMACGLKNCVECWQEWSLKEAEKAVKDDTN